MTLTQEPMALAARERARRRWRVSKSAVTLPLILSRLRRAKVFALTREHPELLKRKGLFGHASYLRRLSVGVRLGGVMENVLQDVRVDRAVQEATELAKDGSCVVTTVDSEDAASASAFWLQGDVELSTRAKFQERFKLRHAPKVNAVLHAFWTAAVRGSGGPERRGWTADSPGLLDTHIGFDEYYQLFSRVYATLLDDYDEDDARRTILDDFTNDAKGDDVLTNSEYGDALFELADMWVRSTEEEDYASFLWALYRGVAEGDPPTWKPAGVCRFDPELAPLDEDDDEEDDEGDGAVGTGRAARGASGRREQASASKARKGAAKCIQSSARGRKSRQARKEIDRAATKLQAARRGQITRRDVGKRSAKRDKNSGVLPPTTTAGEAPKLSERRVRSYEGGDDLGAYINENLAFGSTMSRWQEGGEGEGSGPGGLELSSWDANSGCGGGWGGGRSFSSHREESHTVDEAAVRIQAVRRGQVGRRSASQPLAKKDGTAVGWNIIYQGGEGWGGREEGTFEVMGEVGLDAGKLVPLRRASMEALIESVAGSTSSSPETLRPPSPSVTGYAREKFQSQHTLQAQHDLPQPATAASTTCQSLELHEKLRPHTSSTRLPLLTPWGSTTSAQAPATESSGPPSQRYALGTTPVQSYRPPRRPPIPQRPLLPSAAPRAVPFVTHAYAPSAPFHAASGTSTSYLTSFHRGASLAAAVSDTATRREAIANGTSDLTAWHHQRLHREMRELMDQKRAEVIFPVQRMRGRKTPGSLSAHRLRMAAAERLRKKAHEKPAKITASEASPEL